MIVDYKIIIITVNKYEYNENKYYYDKISSLVLI